MSNEQVELSPLARLLGREIVSSDVSGSVRVRFSPSVQLTNRYGTIQGGILSAMLDSAVSLAVIATLAEGSSPVTVSMTTQYFKAAKPGAIEARAHLLQATKTLAHAEADLYDNSGNRLAHAIATLRILTRS